MKTLAVLLVLAVIFIGTNALADCETYEASNSQGDCIRYEVCYSPEDGVTTRILDCEKPEEKEFSFRQTH